MGMAITEALRLIITADSAGAVRGIQNVSRAAGGLGRSQKQLDQWGTRLTTIGAGLVGFGAVAAYGLGQAAKSASNLSEAVNASNVVFGESTQIIDGYAKDSAKSFGLSETAFRQATSQMGAQLQNLGFDQESAAEQSVNLTRRAADMASVFNTDVTQATMAIGAALRGERDPIERFGVTINEAAVKAKAMELGLAGATGELSLNAKAQASLALIMEQTNKLAGDFANTSDNMANRQRIVAAEFENLKASIGEGALPVMEGLLGAAQTGIGVFEGLNSATGGAVGTIATIGTVASLGVGGLSLLAGQVIKTRDSIAGAGQAIAGFVGTRGLGNLTKTLAKGGLIIGGLLLLEEILDSVFGDTGGTSANIGRLSADLIEFGESGRVAGELLKIAGDDFSDLKEAFETIDVTGVEGARAAVDRFAASIPGVGRALDTGFAKNIDDAKQKVDDFDKALADIASQDPDLAFNLLQDAARALGVDVEELLPVLDDYGAAVGTIASDAAVAGGDVDEFGRSMDGAAESTEDAKSALEEYSDELKSLTDPVFAAMDALTGVRDAQLGLRDAKVAEAEAQAALNEAIAAGDPAAIAEATRNYEDAQRDLADAQWATVESAAEADSALAGLKDAVLNGDVSVDMFKDTLAQWVRQGFLTEEQADAAAESVGDLASQASDADKERVDIPVSTPGSEKSQTQLRRTTNEAMRVPTRRNTNVTTSGTDAARARIRRLKDDISSLRDKTVHVNVAVSGIAQLNIAQNKLLGFQHGGRVPGPIGSDQIILAHGGETVLPTHDKAAMGKFMPSPLAMGAGGSTYIDQRTIQITTGADPQSVVAALRRAGEIGLPITIRGRSL